jgi:hypothetical protein
MTSTLGGWPQPPTGPPRSPEGQARPRRPVTNLRRPAAAPPAPAPHGRPARFPTVRTPRSGRCNRLGPHRSQPCISAGVRTSSSMSVDHVPWSSEMPSGRGWKPGSRRGQPRCPRRPSAGPAPLRWDMNYPPANKSRCPAPIHAIGLPTTTARASALVPDPYRVRAACPQRVRWSQCGQSTDRH